MRPLAVLLIAAVPLFAVACGHAKPPPMPAPEYEQPSQPIEAPSSTPSVSPPSSASPES